MTPSNQGYYRKEHAFSWLHPWGFSVSITSTVDPSVDADCIRGFYEMILDRRLKDVDGNLPQCQMVQHKSNTDRPDSITRPVLSETGHKIARGVAEQKTEFPKLVLLRSSRQRARRHTNSYQTIGSNAFCSLLNLFQSPSGNVRRNLYGYIQYKKLILKMETTFSSETSVYFNQTSRRQILEEENLHIHWFEKLKNENLVINVRFFFLECKMVDEKLCQDFGQLVAYLLTRSFAFGPTPFHLVCVVSELELGQI
jgi:hypothetical protein